MVVGSHVYCAECLLWRRPHAHVSSASPSPSPSPSPSTQQRMGILRKARVERQRGKDLAPLPHNDVAQGGTSLTRRSPTLVSIMGLNFNSAFYVHYEA